MLWLQSLVALSGRLLPGSYTEDEVAKLGVRVIFPRNRFDHILWENDIISSKQQSCHIDVSEVSDVLEAGEAVVVGDGHIELGFGRHHLEARLVFHGKVKAREPKAILLVAVNDIGIENKPKTFHGSIPSCPMSQVSASEGHGSITAKWTRGGDIELGCDSQELPNFRR